MKIEKSKKNIEGIFGISSLFGFSEIDVNYSYKLLQKELKDYIKDINKEKKLQNNEFLTMLYDYGFIWFDIFSQSRREYDEELEKIFKALEKILNLAQNGDLNLTSVNSHQMFLNYFAELLDLIIDYVVELDYSRFLEECGIYFQSNEVDKVTEYYNKFYDMYLPKYQGEERIRLF